MGFTKGAWLARDHVRTRTQDDVTAQSSPFSATAPMSYLPLLLLGFPAHSPCFSEPPGRLRVLLFCTIYCNDFN